MRMALGTRFLKRLLRDEDGSPAVEFAIIAPLLILLTAGMIDVGKLGLASSTLYLAADEGARYAAVHAEGSLLEKTEGEMEAYALEQVIGIKPSDVDIDIDWSPDPAQSGAQGDGDGDLHGGPLADELHGYRRYRDVPQLGDCSSTIRAAL